MKTAIKWILMIVMVGGSVSAFGEMGGMRHHERLRDRLSNAGYSAAQIDTMVDQKRAEMEQIRSQCEAQGLTREECREQFRSQFGGQFGGAMGGQGGNRQGRMQQRRQRCEAQGLTMEECRAQFGNGRRQGGRSFLR